MLNGKPHDKNVWDRRGVTPLILNLGTDGGEWSFSFLGHFTALTCHRTVGPTSGEERSPSYCHESNHDMLVALPMV